MKKLRQLVSAIEAIDHKISVLQAEHDSIDWRTPNMDRATSARGRAIYREAKALRKSKDLLRADIINFCLSAFSDRQKDD